MNWSRIAVYYVLAIGLSFYLQGELRSMHPEQQAPVATTLPFLEAVPERIDRVVAERDNLSIEFRRNEGRWVVAEPPGVVCPNDIVDAVLESLTSVPPIDVVDDSEHGQYGLNPPRIRMRVETAGEIVSTIAFGELNPTHTAVYAKKSGKEDVYLLGLNARYYLDLIFENVRRQLAMGGAAGAPGKGRAAVSARPPEAPPAPPSAEEEPKAVEPQPKAAGQQPDAVEPPAETAPAQAQAPESPAPAATAPKTAAAAPKTSAAPKATAPPAAKSARSATKPAVTGTRHR